MIQFLKLAAEKAAQMAFSSVEYMWLNHVKPGLYDRLKRAGFILADNIQDFIIEYDHPWMNVLIDLLSEDYEPEYIAQKLCSMESLSSFSKDYGKCKQFVMNLKKETGFKQQIGFFYTLILFRNKKYLEARDKLNLLLNKNPRFELGIFYKHLTEFAVFFEDYAKLGIDDILKEIGQSEYKEHARNIKEMAQRLEHSTDPLEKELISIFNQYLPALELSLQIISGFESIEKEFESYQNMLEFIKNENIHGAYHESNRAFLQSLYMGIFDVYLRKAEKSLKDGQLVESSEMLTKAFKLSEDNVTQETKLKYYVSRSRAYALNAKIAYRIGDYTSLQKSTNMMISLAFEGIGQPYPEKKTIFSLILEALRLQFDFMDQNNLLLDENSFIQLEEASKLFKCNDAAPGYLADILSRMGRHHELRASRARITSQQVADLWQARRYYALALEDYYDRGNDGKMKKIGSEIISISGTQPFHEEIPLDCTESVIDFTYQPDVTSNAASLSSHNMMSHVCNGLRNVFSRATEIPQVCYQMGDAFLEYIANAMGDYATDVVHSCPSYFPRETGIQNNRNTFFAASTSKRSVIINSALALDNGVNLAKRLALK